MSKINLPTLYSQTDSRWSSDLLGFNTDSKYNMYNYGCLVTSMAMVCKYYGKDVNPSDINKKLKEKQGFVSGGLYVWGSLSKVFSDISESKIDTPSALNDGQLNEIKGAMDSGYPVVFQLDYNPKTVANDTHYVVGIGYDSSDINNFTIADAIDGKIKSIKDYLGWLRPSVKETVYQYIIYKGKVPTPYEDTTSSIYVENDVYSGLVGNSEKWESLVEYLEIGISAGKVSFDDVKKVIAGLKSRNTDIQNQLTLCQSELKNKEEQVERLEEQLKIESASKDTISKMQVQIDTLAKEKGTLNNNIAELEVEIKSLKAKISDLLKTQAQALSLTDTLLLLVYKLFKIKK